MTDFGATPEPIHINESQLAAGYAEVLNQVASQQQPIIVRRNGENLAALVSIEHLELIRDSLARQEAERLAAALDWKLIVAQHKPPQHWFEDGEPKPF